MFLQGNMGMGFLNIFRNYLWIHIQQYTKREFEVSIHLFYKLYNIIIREMQKSYKINDIFLDFSVPSFAWIKFKMAFRA